MGELVAPFVALLFHAKKLAGARLLVFVGNLGVRSAVVSGRCAVLDMNSAVGGFHLLLARLRITAWWEHVDSKANPTDGGSRLGVACPIAKRLGFRLEERAFPRWPADVSAFAPSDWHDLFEQHCALRSV